MSIISNEHQHGSPLKPAEPWIGELKPLPEALTNGEWEAKPSRYSQSSEWCWDIKFRGRVYGTLHSATKPADVRCVLSMTAFAHEQGALEARRAIREALGIVVRP